MKAAANKGFTLVEMSVVMVILSVLAGTVSVGNDLIRNAKIRKAISQIQQFDTAYTAFYLKYACIPGDCANATALGFKNNFYVQLSSNQVYETSPAMLLNPVSTAYAASSGGGRPQQPTNNPTTNPPANQNAAQQPPDDAASDSRSQDWSYLPQSGYSGAADIRVITNVDGDGDGAVKIGPWKNSRTGTTEVYAESLVTWPLLAQANMINNYNNVSGRVELSIPAQSVVSGAAVQAFWLTSYFTPSPKSLIREQGNYIWAVASIIAGVPAGATVMPADADAIETKIDDRNPRKGRMMATGHANGTLIEYTSGPEYDPANDVGPAGRGNQTCLAKGGKGEISYNVLNSSFSCAIVYKLLSV